MDMIVKSVYFNISHHMQTLSQPDNKQNNPAMD